MKKKKNPPKTPIEQLHQTIQEALNRLCNGPMSLDISSSLYKRGFKAQDIYPLMCQIVRIFEEWAPITRQRISGSWQPNSALRIFQTSSSIENMNLMQWCSKNTDIAKRLKAVSDNLKSHADPYIGQVRFDGYSRILLSDFMSWWAGFLESESFKGSHKELLKKRPRKGKFKDYTIRRVAEILVNFKKGRHPNEDIANIVKVLLDFKENVTPSYVSHALEYLRKERKKQRQGKIKPSVQQIAQPKPENCRTCGGLLYYDAEFGYLKCINCARPYTTPTQK